MPIRGENIGSAYVRIFGDGSSLPGDIEDALDDAEPGVRDAAESHGKAYDEAFGKQLRRSFRGNFGTTKKELINGLNNSLTEATARMELSKRFFDSADWKRFSKRLEREGGAAGKLLAKNLADEFRTSGDLARLPDVIGNELGPRLRESQRELVAMAEGLDDVDRSSRRTRGSVNVLAEAMGNVDDLLARVRANASGTSEELREVDDAIEEMGEETDRTHSRSRRFHDTVTSLNRQFDVMAVRIGRITGRGSRSEFLNFFGGLVEMGTRLLFLLPKIFGGLLDVGRAAFDAFSDGGGGGLLAFIAKGAGKAAAGLALIAAAAAALIVVLGPLIALLSGLVGIITALGGTVVFAAVGALAALAGALVPAVAGIGALVAIFVGAGDRMKRATKPLVDSLKEVRDSLREGFFDGGGLEQTFERLGARMEALVPLSEMVGRALRNTFDGWADRLDSPAFNAFVTHMETFLPDAIEQLGRIGANTIGGLAGLFRGMIPITERFLDWVEKITGEFNDWANSAEGRREIGNFLKDAGDSAKSLGSFLEEAGGFLMDLFDAGRGSGDNIFDDMTNAIKGWREEFEKNPDILKDWFEDAEDLATAIGDAATAAGELMDELDDEESRDNIRKIIGLIETLTGLLSVGIRIGSIPLFNIPSQIKGAWEGLIGWFSRIDFNFGSMQGPDFSKMIQLPNIPKLASHFAGLPGMILRVIGKVDLGGIFRGIGGAIGNIMGEFTGLGDRILKRIGKVDVKGIIKGTGPALLSLLNPFAGASLKIFSRINPVNVAGIIKGAGAAASGLLQAFAGMAGKILGRIDPVNVAGIIKNVGGAVSSLLNPFDGMATRIWNLIGPINVSNIISGAGEAAGNLVEAFRGLAGRIVEAIGTIVPRVSMPNIPGIPGFAYGGIVDTPTFGVFGEGGREALVPLDKPLSQVDPAVRALAAFAQGMSVPSGGGSSIGKKIDVTQYIYAPASDPRAVASETVNRLAVVGY